MPKYVQNEESLPGSHFGSFGPKPSKWGAVRLRRPFLSLRRFRSPKLPKMRSRRAAEDLTPMSEVSQPELPK